MHIHPDHPGQPDPTPFIGRLSADNPMFREADTVEIDEVHYMPISEPITELNMYRAGELDITFAVPGSHIEALRETHDEDLRIAPFLALYYLAFDLSEAPFDDLALRRAFSARLIGNQRKPAISKTTTTSRARARPIAPRPAPGPIYA